MILAASKTGMVLGMVNTGLVMMSFTRMGSSCLPINGVRYDKNSLCESFELFLKWGKSSYRRKPVSSLFKTFWTPAFAGVTMKNRFSKVSLYGMRLRETFMDVKKI